MQDYEKLGVFYLGRRYDLDRRAPEDSLLLYDSRHLTTHALCVGMTGSGKTGLCVSLLEEAAIDGTPAIAIDPKGDLGNLLLSFPELSAQDFLPWVEDQPGVTREATAEDTANKWRAGLAEHGQDASRIRRMREAAELTIYTPGSSAGTQLALLPSFAAPPDAIREDEEALRERVHGAVSALLALVKIDADPLTSREHILLSQIVGAAWIEGRALELASLIAAVQKPAFDKVGVFDLESFFPAKERFGLAMALNAVVASPSAAMQAQGAPLDVPSLLWTAEGKPRIAIVSIAHLSDAQRMFFVTTLLNEVVGWMRTQRGTSSLRAVLYMDEIAGYFPPTAAPPSKAPMLTLLKQARAFGLGVVLATQNPVDLDYKGLSNCGTWMIGRLQTERDKLRVLDGLEGAGRSFDRGALDRTLSALGSRVFLLNDVHASGPVIFETRWTLSYLRGPLSKEELKRLTARGPAVAKPPAPAVAAASARPVVPAEIGEVYFPLTDGDTHRAAIFGVAKVHYVSAKQGLDHWATLGVLRRLGPDDEATWEDAESVEPKKTVSAPSGAKYGEAPAWVTNPARFAALKKSLATFVHQSRPLVLSRCAELELTSKPDESPAAFAERLRLQARERRDEAVDKLEKKYGPKVAALEAKRKKAEDRVEREKREAQAQTVDAALSFGSSVLGALFGKKAMSSANVGRARSALKSANRTMKERQDVAAAEESIEALAEELAALEAEMEGEIAALSASLDPARLTVEKVEIAPRKSDTEVVSVSFAWA